MILSNEEKQAKLLSTLEEWGAEVQTLSYSQAVQQLMRQLSIVRSEKHFTCVFGDYALCVQDYGIFREEELERCRTAIRKYRVGLLKRVKLWVRAFADVKLWENEYFAVAEPNLVLWELGNVTQEQALQICEEASQLLGAPLKLISK